MQTIFVRHFGGYLGCEIQCAQKKTKSTFSLFSKFYEPQKVEGLLYRNFFCHHSQLVVSPPMAKLPDIPEARLMKGEQ